MCRIPASVTTGHRVLLSCHDAEGSPSPTYKWYKDKTPLPVDPSQFPAFKNYTYKINPLNGNLVSGAEYTSPGSYSLGQTILQWTTKTIYFNILGEEPISTTQVPDVFVLYGQLGRLKASSCFSSASA